MSKLGQIIFVSTEYHFTVCEGLSNSITLKKHDQVLANIDKDSLVTYYKNDYVKWYMKVRSKDLEKAKRRQNDVEIMQDEINSIHALYALDPDRGKNGSTKN